MLLRILFFSGSCIHAYQLCSFLQAINRILCCMLFLQVHFFLKRRVGTLSEEEHARLNQLALGLRMLGALPLPWQQRCSALHEHPRLILETLLMGKQLRVASQVHLQMQSLHPLIYVLS